MSEKCECLISMDHFASVSIDLGLGPADKNTANAEAGRWREIFNIIYIGLDLFDGLHPSKFRCQWQFVFNWDDHHDNDHNHRWRCLQYSGDKWLRWGHGDGVKSLHHLQSFPMEAFGGRFCILEQSL